MKSFLGSFYLGMRFFVVLGLVAALFGLAFVVPVLLPVAKIALLGVGVGLVVETLLLYRIRKGIEGHRFLPDKFSNGDDNQVLVTLESHYPFPVRVSVVDELPFQFQARDMRLDFTLDPGQHHRLPYNVRPVTRGEYAFGHLNVYVGTPVSFVQRRYRFAQNQSVAVYPSYQQMRYYELLAISNRLTEAGVKKIRRVGASMEFDQVREYVQGDDFRTINWKASARKTNLMVNQYRDERSQQIYSVIDKGRTMKMPFGDMTLLDYAINASLVLSNIAIYKQDKAGVVTFSNKMGTILPAERTRAQMTNILEVLYKQKTEFLEPDYDKLYANMTRKISTRSLMMLYTNFETLAAMRRRLPVLKRIARKHLLVVIFFENTELHTLLESPAVDTDTLYRKAIAERFALEKKQIVKELEMSGIHAVLTPPKGLTANAVNKYLELKARRMI